MRSACRSVRPGPSVNADMKSTYRMFRLDALKMLAGISDSELLSRYLAS
jgi:hypothetical protein